MSRGFMIIAGVPPETKRSLQEAAQKRFGQANASLLVRSLIAAHLEGRAAPPGTKPLTAFEASDTVRIELRLPRVAVETINRLAENRLTPRNHYLVSLILSHIGQGQLLGDEIEVLRHSNYELSKIGTNLNQIAKAFNILVNGSGDGKVPEIGKKLASLRREISEHTKRVLQVLNAGTAFWEVKQGRGQSLKSGKSRKA